VNLLYCRNIKVVNLHFLEKIYRPIFCWNGWDRRKIAIRERTDRVIPLFFANILRIIKDQSHLMSQRKSHPLASIRRDANSFNIQIANVRKQKEYKRKFCYFKYFHIQKIKSSFKRKINFVYLTHNNLHLEKRIDGWDGISIISNILPRYLGVQIIYF